MEALAVVLAARHDEDEVAVLAVRNDDSGTIDYANPAAGRLFGRAAHELVGTPVERLVPERFRSSHRRLRSTLIAEPEPSRRRTNRVVQALLAGAERMVVVDVAPIADQPDHVLASVRPLESWVDAHAWTLSAFEHSPTPIALVELTASGARIIRAANHALGELLGYDVADLLGTGFDRLTFDEDEPGDRAAAAAIAAGSLERYTRRKRYRHHDGHTVWCDLSSRRLPGNGQPALALAHLTDVSAQIELAELHRDTEARLRDEVASRTRALVETDQLLRQSLVAASMASWSFHVTEDRFELIADDRTWPELRKGRTATDVLALVHPDDAASLAEAVRAATGSGRSFDLTLRTRGDMPRQWVRVAGDAVAGPDGRVDRVIGVVQDVTAFQALIDDLRSSERKLSLSVEAAGIGTWVADLATGVEHWDDATRSIFGLEADQAFTPEVARTKVHPDDLERLLAAMEHMAATGTPLAATFRLLGEDGNRWVQCWSEPVFAPDGSVETVVGVVQDITAERRLVEAAQTGERMLREREDRLRLVLAATTTGTWDWNIAGSTIELSVEFLGHQDTLSGDAPWHWECLVHPDDLATFEAQLSDHFEQRTAFCESVHRLRAGDGSWRWFRTRGRVVDRDESGTPLRMIGAAMDISDQKQLEEQLIHGAKMQALGAFAGSVAHDFNNVMAIVRGHVELLRHPVPGAPPDPAETERRLAAIEQSVDRASSFVRQLMVLGRPEENRPADIDLSAFVLDLAPTLAQFLGEDIAFEVDVPADEFVVRIDAGRLEALLLNLAANARDAMISGGTVTLALRQGRTDDGSNPTAVLDVTDTGIGMDAETAASAFEPFFTTKAPGLGTGLGLASAMATVSAAGGTMDISSAVGAGTTITVKLPMTDGSTPLERPSRHPLPSSRSGTVLLVEDEAELLELTADAVRARGHRVHTALSGAEALEILASDAVDLIVTDVVMPGMSGVELAATVAQRWPRIPIVFVTGYASGDEAVPTANAEDTLAKPVPLGVLLEAIESRLPAPPADRTPR
ncbi:MAG: PAS domain S-box protein [Acidimicrobiales bacterium]